MNKENILALDGSLFSYRWSYTGRLRPDASALSLEDERTGTTQIRCVDRPAFYELLAKWNKLGQGTWIYWEV